MSDNRAISTGQESWNEEEVTFYSEGSQMWGRIYIPKAHSKGEKRAAWVTASGFTGTHEFVDYTPGACRRLAYNGYVTFLFDYRGYGKSRAPGEIPIVDPMKQAKDLQNAITYLQTRDEVDETRIGMIGWSFGGALVLYVTAIDERVAATVSISGIGDGRRWLKSLRSHAAWKAFLEELEEDRKQRVLTGKGRVVPTTYVMPSEGATRKWLDEATAKGHHGGDILLQTAEEVIYFKPEDFVHMTPPRPVLYVLWPPNRLVNCEEGLSMYQKTGLPKTLWLLPKDAFRESPYEAWPSIGDVQKEHLVFDGVISWVKKNLPNHVVKAGEKEKAPDLDVGFESPFRKGTWLRA